jgi:hypothetical protein
MTSRMQITLDRAQRAAVARKAAASGISISEYVRRLVAADLGEHVDERADVTAVFDLGDSGGADVARRKDEYVGEAVAAGRRG